MSLEVLMAREATVADIALEGLLPANCGATRHRCASMDVGKAYRTADQSDCT